MKHHICATLKAIVHLYLHSFGWLSVNPKIDVQDCKLPNLKYPTLVGALRGKLNYFYDKIVEKYAAQLIGLDFRCGDYVTSRRNFPILEFLFAGHPGDLPQLCPKLEFLYVLSGSNDSTLTPDMPNLKQLVYEWPESWVSQIIRSNKQACLHLLPFSQSIIHEVTMPTTYTQG